MIVVPMAGVSRRFVQAGYDCQKYRLPLAGRTLFDWVMLSFSRAFGNEPFLFVVRDDDAGASDFVRSRALELGIQQFRIVCLDRPTGGQAETVERGLRSAGVDPATPITIFNIDTIRRAVDTSPLAGTSGWLEIFRAEGENWSFIETDPADSTCVIRTTEKKRISDLCCTGLYRFDRTSDFLLALDAERASGTFTELFVAPLYNHLISRGLRIGWREVLPEEVLLSGVPAEYEALTAGHLAAFTRPNGRSTPATKAAR